MAQQLSPDFYQMLKTKNNSQLNQWFIDVSQSGLVDLQRMQQQYMSTRSNSQEME
ncbi:hypothetical protein KXL21_005065 [Salmonella enterica]|nr:hypothetical protein [Salmonella enterica]EIJ9585520.1 hypothetical protein [Salmonella enterica]EJX0850524.1 hypothetical protein [Salmonella enterica]